MSRPNTGPTIEAINTVTIKRTRSFKLFEPTQAKQDRMQRTMELVKAVEQAAHRLGCSFRTQYPAKTSKTCPKCLSYERTNRVGNELSCADCGVRWDVQALAAYNVGAFKRREIECRGSPREWDWELRLELARSEPAQRRGLEALLAEPKDASTPSGVSLSREASCEF